MIAPAARSFLTTPASSGTIDLSKLNDPAVVFMPGTGLCSSQLYQLSPPFDAPSDAIVAILSLSKIGMPCNSLRFPVFLRSASSSAASLRADGFSSSTARS